jgi:hypothetical protein
VLGYLKKMTPTPAKQMIEIVQTANAVLIFDI